MDEKDLFLLYAAHTQNLEDLTHDDFLSPFELTEEELSYVNEQRDSQ